MISVISSFYFYSRLRRTVQNGYGNFPSAYTGPNVLPAAVRTRVGIESDDGPEETDDESSSNNMLNTLIPDQRASVRT